MKRFNSHSTITCCLGCAERRAGCHGSCERYATEKSAHEKACEERREKRLREWDYQGFVCESVDRIRGRR